MRTSTTSGLKSADAAITARPALITAITLIPAAADCNVVLYDNSTNSGTVLAKVTALANTASQTVAFNHPVEANTAVYADVTGASANYIVHYSLL